MLVVDVSALLWPEMHSSVIGSSQFETLESRMSDDADPRPLEDLPWPVLQEGCWIGSIEYLPGDLVRITPWSTGAALQGISCWPGAGSNSWSITEE